MISELRTDLVDQLAPTEVTVYNMMPDDFDPPGLIVMPPTDGTYIAGGQFKGSYEVAFDVLVLVAKEDDLNLELTNIDNLVEKVIEHTMNWGLRGVDASGLINIQGIQYPGTIVHIATQREL